MKYNPFACHQPLSVWLYCGNPQTVNISWWFYVVSVVIPSLWFYNRDHLIFLCHPNSFNWQTLLNTLVLLYYLKYCCTHPVHAHKDKLKLCNDLFCVGHNGCDVLLDLPLNWAVFGLLKVGSVILRETCTCGRHGRISLCSFCTNRQLGGCIIHVHSNAKLSLSLRCNSKLLSWKVLPCAGQWQSPQEVLEVLLCVCKHFQ